MAMAVAMGASTAFLTPISHSANLLVMGPGGYKFRDYARVGLPLTLVLFGALLAALAVFWNSNVYLPTAASRAGCGGGAGGGAVCSRW